MTRGTRELTLPFAPRSREEEDEDEDEDKDIPGGASGRWSPLSGARLEEMVREATRLAAQLEQCHLPPRGTPPTPRSPRRQTFVVKDSPVRALLPTVESPPTATRSPPAKPRGPPAVTNVPSTRKVGDILGWIPPVLPVWPHAVLNPPLPKQSGRWGGAGSECHPHVPKGAPEPPGWAVGTP